MKLAKVMAATLAAFALTACVGGAIIPVPVDSRPTVSSYTERHYYPSGTYTEYYRYP
jgi:hypothetical protein